MSESMYVAKWTWAPLLLVNLQLVDPGSDVGG